MSILFIIGIWVLCGGVMSFLVYYVDERKCDRTEVYTSNLYIVFMVLFWPIAFYFFLRLFVSIVFKKFGGSND